MHIAYYAPVWPPEGAANGIVTYVSAMRRQLLSDGHEVSVVSQGRLFTSDGAVHDLRTETRPSVWDRMRIPHRLRRQRGDHPAMARKLAGELRAARERATFDLLEMEESFGWCRVAQQALDVPVVTRLHGPHFRKSPTHESRHQQRHSRQRIAAEGCGIRAAAAVSAPTSATLEAAQARYGDLPAATAIIPNPVQPLDEAEHAATERERNTILYVGRFDHAKGADTLLDAFSRLASVRRDLRLVLVGPDAGLTLPGGVTLGFADYAARYLFPNVRDRVEFTGILTPQRIADLRRRAVLTVVSSRSENFPYAAVEAMAAASPVVATAWPGSAELIRDGVTGWLTPVGMPDPLAERIGWVVDHPDVARQVGAAAWRQCRETYAPDRVARRSVDFYSNVLARHADRR
jgi:glycosyltransferase involved in cell wall biosynthesis